MEMLAEQTFKSYMSEEDLDAQTERWIERMMRSGYQVESEEKTEGHDPDEITFWTSKVKLAKP